MNVAAEKWWRDEETGDLELEVSGVPIALRFDGDAHGVHAWKKVDFVFHWPEQNELWLVEVKDPDNPHAKGDTNGLIERFQSEKLIYGSLAQKAKDSFLYVFLDGQLPANTKILYVVLFACGRLKPGQQARHYLNATKALRRALGLDGPGGGGWAKHGIFIRDCLILSLEQWNARVGTRVQVRRLSTSHE